MASAQIVAELEAFLPDDFPDLGEVEEVHLDQLQGSPAGNLFAGIGFLVFGLVFVAGGAFIQPEPDQKVAMRVALFGFGGLLMAGGAVALFLSRRASGRRFEFGTHWLFCRRGLILIEEGKPKGYPWGQVEVWFNVVVPDSKVGVHHTYSLRAGKKRKDLPLPPKGMLGGAIKGLQRRMADALLPGYVERIHAGEAVHVGLFTFTKTTLAAESYEVTSQGLVTWPWKEIKGFEFKYDLDRETILVHVRGRPPRSIHVSNNMPNLWLFYRLIAAVCPRAGETIQKPERYLL